METLQFLFVYFFFVVVVSSVNTSNWSWNPSSFTITDNIFFFGFVLKAFPFAGNVCVCIDRWLLVYENVDLKWLHLSNNEWILNCNIKAKSVWLSMTHHCWTFGNWYFIMKSWTLSNENLKHFFSISFYSIVFVVSGKSNMLNTYVLRKFFLLLFFSRPFYQILI